MKIDIANLNTEEIKEKYPKSYALLEQFITEGIKNDLEGTDLSPDQIVEIMQGLIANGVRFHHRILFDFFDTQRMFIITDYVNDGEEWYAIINNVEQEYLPNRTEAEINGVNEAFIVLEKELDK